MALTAGSIIWYGPLTATIKTSSSSTKALSNINIDAVSWGLETKTGNVVLKMEQKKRTLKDVN